MGSCASKPKGCQKEVVPVPGPAPIFVIEKSLKTATTTEVKEVKVENEEKVSDVMVDEKKVDEGEKKVEEENQSHVHGDLLIEGEAKKEAIEDKKVIEVSTETKEEDSKVEAKVEVPKEPEEIVKVEVLEETKLEEPTEEVKKVEELVSTHTKKEEPKEELKKVEELVSTVIEKEEPKEEVKKIEELVSTKTEKEEPNQAKVEAVKSAEPASTIAAEFKVVKDKKVIDEATAVEPKKVTIEAPIEAKTIIETPVVTVAVATVTEPKQ